MVFIGVLMLVAAVWLDMNVNTPLAGFRDVEWDRQNVLCFGPCAACGGNCEGVCVRKNPVARLNLGGGMSEGSVASRAHLAQYRPFSGSGGGGTGGGGGRANAYGTRPGFATGAHRNVGLRELHARARFPAAALPAEPAERLAVLKGGGYIAPTPFAFAASQTGSAPFASVTSQTRSGPFASAASQMRSGALAFSPFASSNPQTSSSPFAFSSPEATRSLPTASNAAANVGATHIRRGGNGFLGGATDGAGLQKSRDWSKSESAGAAATAALNAGGGGGNDDDGDDDGDQKYSQLTTAQATAPFRLPRDYSTRSLGRALIIGNGYNRQDESLRLGQNPINDAHEMYKFAHDAMHIREILVLTDEDVRPTPPPGSDEVLVNVSTLTNTLRALDVFFGQLQPGTRLICTMSVHGRRIRPRKKAPYNPDFERLGNDVALVTADLGVIRDLTLWQKLRTLDNKNIFLLTLGDLCQFGTGWDLPTNMRYNREHGQFEIVPGASVRHKRPLNVVAVSISACTDWETAKNAGNVSRKRGRGDDDEEDDDDTQMGAFSEAFVHVVRHGGIHQPIIKIAVAIQRYLDVEGVLQDIQVTTMHAKDVYRPLSDFACPTADDDDTE
jgi:hypothetical protein